MEGRIGMYCADKLFRLLKAMAAVLLVAGYSESVIGQTDGGNLYFMKLHSYSGEARLDGFYREKERTFLEYQEAHKSSNLSGGLKLRATTSVLHPNFMMLDMDGAYMPETRRENFIMVPDQSEVRTIKKIGASARFFQNRIVNFAMFGSYDQGYSTRENLTNIKSTGKHWGGNLGCINKVLPVTFDFQSHKWDEEELQSARKYNHDQQSFSARTYKSFTSRDRSELRFSHDELVNINQNRYRVGNINNTLDFTNSLSLDSAKRYRMNTLINNFNQHGTSNLNRFQAGELIDFQLPANLFYTGNYNFYNINFESHRLLQHSVVTGLEHQLFNSLRSRVSYEYNNLKNTVFSEANSKAGIRFNYLKKIPKGSIQLGYQYDRYSQDHFADSSSMIISNEQYLLADTKITLLRHPDVDEPSVVIKDMNGTFFFQKDLDYILVTRGKYLEIRRIPGGNIPNETTVLVDYSAAQPGTYKYDANAHAVTSALNLFSNKLVITYRFAIQDYLNLVSTDFVTLNYFTQNQIGCRVDFGFVSAGAEYEDYQSSIIPYKMWRYYVNFQKNLGSRLMAMVNGNMQDYVMLDGPQPVYQKFMDLTGKISYDMFRQTRVNLDLMWRKQEGRGIDLNLLSARAEVTSTFNKLYFTFGAEIYRRNYIGEKINFKGTYIKIVRRF